MKSDIPKFQITYKPSLLQAIFAKNLTFFVRPPRYLILVMIFLIFLTMFSNATVSKPFLNWPWVLFGIFIGLVSFIVFNVLVSAKVISNKILVSQDTKLQFFDEYYLYVTDEKSKKVFYRDLKAIRIAGNYIILYTSSFKYSNWIYVKYYAQKQELIEFLYTKCKDTRVFKILDEA